MACRTKIPMVDLDHFFQNELEQFTLSTRGHRRFLPQGSEAVAEQEELLGALLRERERLTKEADKLYHLYQEDALSVDGFRERQRPLEERLAGLGMEIPRLQGEIDFLKVKTVMQDDIVNRTRDLAQNWLTMYLPQKRTVVESLVKRITIHKDIVESSRTSHLSLRSWKARLDRASGKSMGQRRLASRWVTLLNWERNHTRVQTRFLPRVFAFLGYDPREETGRLGERIRALREQQALAGRLGREVSD
jgi:hypothetical protein